MEGIGSAARLRENVDFVHRGDTSPVRSFIPEQTLQRNGRGIL